MKFLPVLICLVVLFNSCEEDIKNYMIVSPEQSLLMQQSGDIVQFSVQGKSESVISSLKVTFTPKNKLAITVLDTAIGQEEFIIKWQFAVPYFEDSVVQGSMFFEGIREDGGISIQSAKTLIIESSPMLSESSGHEIFSAISTGSSNFDAFNLASNKPVHSSLADSSLLHILEATDSTNGTSLSQKWVSPAGATFVRFTDFDYANTTYNKLVNAFNAGISSPFVDQLKPKDIILVKYNTPFESRFVAIKIVSVIDETGVENDRYIFNVKRL